MAETIIFKCINSMYGCIYTGNAQEQISHFHQCKSKQVEEFYRSSPRQRIPPKRTSSRSINYLTQEQAAKNTEERLAKLKKEEEKLKREMIDKKPEKIETEDEKPENKETEDEKLENKETEDEKKEKIETEDEKPENKETEDEKLENKETEDEKKEKIETEDEKPENKETEDKKPEKEMEANNEQMKLEVMKMLLDMKAEMKQEIKMELQQEMKAKAEAEGTERALCVAFKKMNNLSEGTKFSLQMNLEGMSKLNDVSQEMSQMRRKMNDDFLNLKMTNDNLNVENLRMKQMLKNLEEQLGNKQASFMQYLRSQR